MHRQLRGVADAGRRHLPGAGVPEAAVRGAGAGAGAEGRRAQDPGTAEPPPVGHRLDLHRQVQDEQSSRSLQRYICFYLSRVQQLNPCACDLQT